MHNVWLHLNPKNGILFKRAAQILNFEEGKARLDGGTVVSGGEGGIRTPGTVTRTPHFECGAIDHSATSPLYRRACGSRAVDSRPKAPCQPPFRAIFRKVDLGLRET